MKHDRSRIALIATWLWRRPSTPRPSECGPPLRGGSRPLDKRGGASSSSRYDNSGLSATQSRATVARHSVAVTRVQDKRGGASSLSRHDNSGLSATQSRATVARHSVAVSRVQDKCGGASSSSRYDNSGLSATESRATGLGLRRHSAPANRNRARSAMAIAGAAAAWLLLAAAAWAQDEPDVRGQAPAAADPPAAAPAAPPLSAAMFLIKADWSTSPNAKAIGDELRAALKDAKVPQLMLDALPASGPQALFPPDIRLNYSIEHFAEMAAWLRKNGLIEKELPFVPAPAAPTPSDEAAGSPRGPTLIANHQLELTSENFLEFPSLPASETPFVTRTNGYVWSVQDYSAGEYRPCLFQRSIGTVEQARGQEPSPMRVLDHLSFSFTRDPRQVVVFGAFPTSRELAWRDLAQKTRGFVPIVVVWQPGDEAQMEGTSWAPRLHLPDSVATIEPSSGPEWNFDLSRGWSMFGGSRPPANRSRGGTSATARPAAPKAPESNLRIFRLKHVSAASAESLAARLFPEGTTIVADVVSNSLIVRAADDKITEIEALLMAIDQLSEGAADRSAASPDDGGKGTGSSSGSSRAKTAPSGDQLRQEYDRLEQAAADQARRVRSLQGQDPRKAAAAKDQLRRTVAEAFAAREKLHQQELADLRRQMQSIEESIQMRSNVKDQIIDRRVEDLLHPERKWPAADSAAAPVEKHAAATPVAGETPRGARDPFDALRIQAGLTEKMQGTWVEIAQDQNGRRGDVLKHGFNFTFSGNSFELRQFTGVYAKGTFRLVESGSEHQGLDLHRTWNKLAGDGGAPQRDLGIVRLEGDLLAWCYGGQSPDERPSDFTTQADDGRVLTIWRRISAKPLTDDEFQSFDFGALSKTDRPPDESPGSEDDAKLLRGVWEVVVAPGDEPKSTVGKQTRLMFSDSRLAVFDGDKRTRLWDVSLDTGIRPKRIVLTGLAGTPSARGIYDLLDDALRMNITDATAEWPKEFGAGGRFEFRRVSRDIPPVFAIVEPLRSDASEPAATPAGGNPSSSPGSSASPPADKAAPPESTQVSFLSPERMTVRWASGGRGLIDSQPLVCPARANFERGKTYDLELSRISGRDGLELYPTLELPAAAPESAEFLRHNAVPIRFSDESIDRALSGENVTRVVYLPKPPVGEGATGVETIVSERLDPGVDPIAEARQRGTILAIVRLGNRVPAADAAR